MHLIDWKDQAINTKYFSNIQFANIFKFLHNLDFELAVMLSKKLPT